MTRYFVTSAILALFVCLGETRPDSDLKHKGNCAGVVSALPPDPKTGCCGVDTSSDERIILGKTTSIDQYPWLVLIEYMDKDSVKTLCSGVLISGKYVLTAAHCVVGLAVTNRTPKNIRLGEYNIKNNGPDCVTVEAGGSDCTEGEVTREIEEIIPHPQYKPTGKNRNNDIALIRLKESAPFTDFIRPICLPSEDVAIKPPADFSTVASGWHTAGATRRMSDVKIQENLLFKNMSTCQAEYAALNKDVELWEGQLCASVRPDAQCLVGPLMYNNGHVFEVLGIDSFGPIPCGVNNTPDVYTKVHHYLDWIRSTIKP